MQRTWHQRFRCIRVRAHLLPQRIRSYLSKAVIYIEKTPLGFYYHSNFITPGFTNPTKIASDKMTDVQKAFYNIRYSQGSDEAGQMQTVETFRDDVHILLDRSVFSAGGYPLVDVKDAKNVAIVNGLTGAFLGRADTLTRTSPPPILLAKILGCCLFGIPPHLAARYQKALEQRSFDKDDVRFLSLIRDSGTESAISRSLNLTSSRLGRSGVSIRELSQDRERLSDRAGQDGHDDQPCRGD